MPRKPQPRHLKVLRGMREDRIPDPVPADTRELTRPGWLAPEAKREWNRLVPQLKRWGLGLADRACLAMLCQEWAHYVAAQQVLEEEGSTYVTPTGFAKRRPEVSLAARHLDNVRKLAGEFGLTLSSRGRVAVPEGPGQDDPASDFLS